MNSPLAMPLVVFASVFLTLATGLAAPPAVPLPSAHAHNDYEHARPLLDALDHGFCSVEADVFLVDGQLLVAHDRPKVRPERTLQALYLDPLRARITANGGRVHAGGPSLTLLVDFKSEAESTYARLKTVLADYRSMLTVFRPDHTEPRAVTVIVSGNRPWQTMKSETERLAGFDGRLPDLDSNPSPHLVPLVSDNWRLHFQWTGSGPFPAAEKSRLDTLVSQAHSQGRRLRFWGAPDVPEIWRVHADAGVDLVNTDRLAALAECLASRRSGSR